MQIDRRRAEQYARLIAYIRAAMRDGSDRARTKAQPWIEQAKALATKLGRIFDTDIASIAAVRTAMECLLGHALESLLEDIRPWESKQRTRGPLSPEQTWCAWKGIEMQWA